MARSIASIVREHVEESPSPSFIAAAEISQPRPAVNAALAQLHTSGDLYRARPGLYWKGVQTRLGTTKPTSEALALRVAGIGSGAEGICAAHWLGLTTQVPSRWTFAMAGRALKGWHDVRFVARPQSRRDRELRPIEVAFLEVVRAGPGIVEKPWSAVAAVAEQLEVDGYLRPSLVADQIEDEQHADTIARWNDLGLNARLL